MKFLYRSEAVEDVAGARDWYEEQRSGLGDDFVSALERSLSLVARMPDSFPVVHRDVRRVLLGRFPYALYYRRMDEDSVEIIACLHTRRSPHILRSRD